MDKYLDRPVMPEILAAIQLLVEKDGSCKVFDVLQLAKMPQDEFARTVVVEIAIRCGFYCKKSSKGFRIYKSNPNQ